MAIALGGTYEIVKRYQAEVTAADLDRADCVLLYYWLQIERLAPLRAELLKVRNRLVVGICSHYELDGAWREPGLATLQEFTCAVFANNRSLFEEFGPQVGKPIYYTPNGVDTEFFTPARFEEPAAAFRPLRVGWAGSLTNHGSEHRGVNEVIAPAVKASGAELRLAVREEKWRDRDEMLEFYRSLDLYVCASRSEGTPNPCLEAAACGLPVITTRVGNMPELIRDGENGYFIERDVVDLVERLRCLRDDSGLRIRMGQTARAGIEEWDWRRQAARYEVMLREVLAGGPETKGSPA